MQTSGSPVAAERNTRSENTRSEKSQVWRTCDLQLQVVFWPLKFACVRMRSHLQILEFHRFPF